MSLDDLLREVIASGKLHEPFSATEATRAVALEDWPFQRVQSYLVRHCMGNLAATMFMVERVSFGKYQLIYDGPREATAEPSPRPGPFGGVHRKGAPISPGDPES
jgi:hypothetical protein